MHFKIFSFSSFLFQLIVLLSTFPCTQCSGRIHKVRSLFLYLINMGQWQKEMSLKNKQTTNKQNLLKNTSFAKTNTSLFLSSAFLLWCSRPSRFRRLPNDTAEQLGLRNGTWTWWFSWGWLGHCLYTQRMQDSAAFYARRWVRRLFLSLKCHRFKKKCWAERRYCRHHNLTSVQSSCSNFKRLYFAIDSVSPFRTVKVLQGLHGLEVSSRYEVVVDQEEQGRRRGNQYEK